MYCQNQLPNQVFASRFHNLTIFFSHRLFRLFMLNLNLKLYLLLYLAFLKLPLFLFSEHLLDA